MATRFRIAEADRFPGQVTNLVHIANANKIVKEKLTPTQLDMFKRTVFGRFVDVDMVFNSPIVHHMLLRKVKRRRSNSMSFSVYGKYFGNRVTKDTLHLRQLEEKYKDLEFENDDAAVKISLVYYTEVTMMEKNKQKNAIYLKRFKDVQNLEYYNSLDWGTIIWERTLDALKTALNDKSSLYKTRVKANKNYVVKYSLRGFPQAFHISFVCEILLWMVFFSLSVARLMAQTLEEE
ncbi:uncharacterized protein LOC120084191 [Benincasa hispida]|uniref:uncharacterized protein LOC120084191 n=1 Tax=Benincasa hispida TaxID=102211 RepID=UPI001900FB0C|nr:uncharacterized protein LOC120084191 [Benincasa hispida]